MEKNRQAVIFWVLLGLAVASRAVYLDFSIYSVSYDPAMVGLAALHWHQGSDFPLISYGQAYLGTLEAIVAALLFKILGYGMAGLTLSPLLFAVAFVVVVYFFAKEMGGKNFGLLAMAFAAVPSPFLAVWSSAVKGGYPETLFFGTLLLWLAWRPNKKYFWIGAVGGFAWWCHPLSIYYLVSSALYLTWFMLGKGFFKKLAAGLGGFLLFSAPFWLYNLQNHFLSFQGGSGALWHRAADGVRNFATQAIPSMFNLNPVDGSLFAQILSAAVIFLFAVSLLFVARRPLFLLFFLSLLFFYSTNKFGVKGETRYVMFLFSLFPFSLAWLCQRLRPWGILISSLPLIFVLAQNSLAIIHNVPMRRARAEIENGNLKTLIDYLNEMGISRIVSFLGPIVSVATEEKIIGAEPYEGRFQPHAIEVDAAENVAVVRSKTNPPHPSVEPALKAAGLSFETLETPIASVYHSFVLPLERLEEIPADLWRGESSLSSETVPFAYDRNLAWYWTAGAIKSPGQTYTLHLGRPEPVRVVRLYNGFALFYSPVILRVETTRDGKTWDQEVLVNPVTPVYTAAGRPFWIGYHTWVEVRLSGKPITALRLIEDGASINHTWRINELYLYRAAGKTKKPDAADFKNLLEFLTSRGIAFVYADRHLSAKINLESDGKIEVCRPYNAKYPYQKNSSRRIDLTKPWAAVLTGLDSSSSEKWLQELKISYKKKQIGPHLVLWGAAHSTPAIPLEWTGLGIVKFSYVPRLPAISAPNAAVPAAVVFEDTLEFLGAEIAPAQVRPGGSFQIRYRWRLKKPFAQDWAPFVHFQIGEKLFQNDHAFYHGQFPLKHWKAGEIISETYDVKVPKDFPEGEADIWLGVVKLDKKRERTKISSSSYPTKSRRACVGKLAVSSSAQSRN